ncbi:MAG: ATP-dependent protease ATPase subunit HslU [Holosporales bacterium]|jgi:ATP-dependent HslUV protease ATP-binding subunit HslU
MESLTPLAIVAELDRHIIGQKDAKRAVAVALRNRWRRLQLEADLRDEVLPKNILMIGPTGVGKTEISRRLAKLAGAPFLKVEATKFTEVGYVGRDVDSIVRDLVENAIHLAREASRKDVEKTAAQTAEDRLILALVGEDASEETKSRFKDMLRAGKLSDREVEIDVADAGGSGFPTFDIPGMPGAQMGMINVGEMFGKAMGMQKTKRRKLLVPEALDALVADETEKLLDNDTIINDALHSVQENGIVFIDEIDKICARSDYHGGGDVSREGVQRDLLPLIEGTTVATKHGAIKTDHILFICSGAFHMAKPSDMLPELQGRLPIRVELKPLTASDFRRILTEPHASLLRQYEALLGTEGVTLRFDDAAVDRLAHLAAHLNETVENIGARRLHTVLERLLDGISFDAPERKGETITVTVAMVEENLATLAKNTDLSRFIL